MNCSLCHQEVDPKSTAQLVTAYAMRRGATGGINSIKGEQRWHDDFVHSRCLDLAKRGHRFGQQSMEMGEAA